jgi:hypothetical protein
MAGSATRKLSVILYGFLLAPAMPQRSTSVVVGAPTRHPMTLSLPHGAQWIATMPCIGFKQGRYDLTPTAAVLTVRKVRAIHAIGSKIYLLGKALPNDIFSSCSSPAPIAGESRNVHRRQTIGNHFK